MRSCRMKLLTALVLLCALLISLPCARAETVQGHIPLLWEGGFPARGAAGAAQIADTGFEEYIVSQLKKEKTSIDVSSYRIRKDAFESAYMDVFFGHPELFFVSGEFSFTHEGGYVSSLLPVYLYTGEKRAARTAAYDRSVAEIVAYARQADTTVGRLMLINDYFCAHYEYDLTYSIYSPDVLFSEKTGVCQAYMLGVCAVLNELGIPNTYAISEGMNHTWNMVRVDGSWYHLDVTWNDPVYDAVLGVRYTHFLLSDRAIADTGHYGWDAAHQADSGKYDDYFWRNLHIAAPVVKDHIFYIGYGAGGRRLMLSWDIAGEKEQVLFEYAGEDAFCATQKRVYYVESSLQETERPGVYAYYDCVYSVDHDGGKRELEYVMGDPRKRILRMYLYDGNLLRMFASADSYYDGDLIEINIYDSLTLSLRPGAARLGFGDALQLVPQFSRETNSVPPLTYESSNAQIVSVDGEGLATGLLPGTAVITAGYRDLLSAQCEITVQGDKVLVLPVGTKAIGEEAFLAADADHVVLPEGLEAVGARAFAACEDLLYVNLPDSLASIAADAFDGCESLTLVGGANSGVQAYAEAQGIAYVLLTEPEKEEPID